MKIAVAGVGYVGLSLAVLLSQHDEGYAAGTTMSQVIVCGLKMIRRLKNTLPHAS